MLDGELVILDADGREEFDALQNRLHPAESRVRMLAAETPALFRAFDLLAEGKEKLLTRPFAERRERLESMVAGLGGRRKSAAGSIELTPLAGAPPRPRPWLESGEGVIAKQLDAPYRPGERKGMVKVKRVRTRTASWSGGGPGRRRAPWAP